MKFSYSFMGKVQNKSYKIEDLEKEIEKLGKKLESLGYCQSEKDLTIRKIKNLLACLKEC